MAHHQHSSSSAGDKDWVYLCYRNSSTNQRSIRRHVIVSTGNASPVVICTQLLWTALPWETKCGCSITPPRSGIKPPSSSKFDTPAEHIWSRMIWVNYTSVAGDFCALMIEQLQAIPAALSIFATSAHFPPLVHRETSRLISLTPLHYLIILHRNVTQTSPPVLH